MFDEIIGNNPEIKVDISRYIPGLVYRSSPVYKPDIGYHFGTLQAATDRMLDLERDYDIFPYKININNPLRLRDIGAWADFKDVADELLKLGVISENEYFKAEEFARTQGLSGDEHKILRNILKNKGYDGIVYRNDSEDKGNDSFIVFDKSDIHEITNLSLFKTYQKAKINGNNTGLVKSVESVMRSNLHELKVRKMVREILKEIYSEPNYKNNFVGIHCSPKSFNDDYDGTISEEYYSSFKSILETIQKDYPDAKRYLDQIDLLDDGLDLYGDSADLVFDIESFFMDNNIEWIYVATEALTKYGDNCYNVYFDNLNDVYQMNDELVDNATIYIYDSSINKPILEERQ